MTFSSRFPFVVAASATSHDTWPCCRPAKPGTNCAAQPRPVSREADRNQTKIFRPVLITSVVVVILNVLLLSNMSASEVPPVSSLEEKKATTEAPIVLVDIDLATGYPISEDSKIISPKLLAEKYCSKEILESLKKAVIAGDQQAAALLLALSWHVLPPQQASASVDLITGKKEKNALTCYYLALFFNAGFGVERDQRIAANFLLTSCKGGCQIAGYEFCDILYFTKTQSTEMFNMWKNLMKDPLSQEYLARIGIFEFYGIFTEKNESTGLLKINNAAKNGVKFANYELALKSRLRMELQTATPLAKAALFENNLNSYVLYGDLLLNNGDEDAALLLFYQAARKMNPNGWKRLATYFKWKKEYVEYTKLIFLIELERSANEKFTGRKEEPKEFVEALKEVQKYIIQPMLPKIQSDVSDMWKKHYYFNADLENKLKANEKK